MTTNIKSEQFLQGIAKNLPEGLQSPLNGEIEYKGTSYTQILFPIAKKAANATNFQVQNTVGKGMVKLVQLTATIFGITLDIFTNAMTLGVKPLLTNYFADRDIKNLANTKAYVDKVVAKYDAQIEKAAANILKKIENASSLNQAIVTLIEEIDKSKLVNFTGLNNKGINEDLSACIKKNAYLSLLKIAVDEFKSKTGNGISAIYEKEFVDPIYEKAKAIASCFGLETEVVNIQLCQAIGASLEDMEPDVSEDPVATENGIRLLAEKHPELYSQFILYTDELDNLQKLINEQSEKIDQSNNSIDLINLALEQKRTALQNYVKLEISTKNFKDLDYTETGDLIDNINNTSDVLASKSKTVQMLLKEYANIKDAKALHDQYSKVYDSYQESNKKLLEDVLNALCKIQEDLQAERNWLLALKAEAKALETAEEDEITNNDILLGVVSSEANNISTSSENTQEAHPYVELDEDTTSISSENEEPYYFSESEEAPVKKESFFQRMKNTASKMISSVGSFFKNSAIKYEYEKGNFNSNDPNDFYFKESDTSLIDDNSEFSNLINDENKVSKKHVTFNETPQIFQLQKDSSDSKVSEKHETLNETPQPQKNSSDSFDTELENKN